MHPVNQKASGLHELRTRLMDVMWDDVGVVRTESGLQRGLEKLDDIEKELQTCGIESGSLAFNLSWHDWLNLSNLIEISRVIGKAALRRENSRGAHWRSDFSDSGSLEESDFTQAQYKNSSLHLSQQPVDFSIVKPGESLLSDDNSL